MARSQELSIEEQMKLEEQSEDFRAYKVPDSLSNCDKDHHYERSCHNDEKHFKVEKKVKRKRELVNTLSGIIEFIYK